MDLNNLRGLMEAYQQVNAPQEVDEKFSMTDDPSKPQSPKPTKLSRSRERNIGHDDWKDDPNKRDWGERPPAGKKLKSRASAVTGTQRRQDKETGIREDKFEEARQLRPASERMARTMTASDRAKQKRERELRDAGQQALADIRALAKGKSSRTTPSSTQSTPDAEVRRLPKGQKVDKLAMKAKKAMSEDVEVFDVVLDFLCSEGYVETLEEAEWIMANEFDSEDIAAILEAYGEPMTKRQEYLTKKVAKMNKEKSGSAHTSIKGKQNPGAALNQANKSAMQMRGL